VLENKNFAFFSKYFIGIFFQNTTSQRFNATNMKFIITLGLIMVATACAPSKCQNRLASLFGDMSSSEPSESNQINIFLIGNRFIYKPNKPSKPSKPNKPSKPVEEPVKELNNDQECGQRFFGDHTVAQPDTSGKIQPKIVGGSPAERGSLPWQVSIQTWYHFCGGTIIGKRWILTAAHCFGRLGIEDVKVRAGEHNLEIAEGTEWSMRVVKVFNHPRYGASNLRNDIALLKLSHDLQFDSYTQPACLPKLANENYDYAPGSDVTVSGWGRMKLSKSVFSAKVLQAVTIPLISDTACKKPDVYGNLITSSMFCAGQLGVGGVDSCQGDSGGPAVKKVNGKWTVLGITSWGSGCGAPNKPGVYTRVARFQQWIQDTMKNN